MHRELCMNTQQIAKQILNFYLIQLEVLFFNI